VTQALLLAIIETVKMWQNRELIWNLTVVDLKNRYQNTALGFFWSLLSPLLMAFVLYFVFRHLYGQEQDFAVNLLVGIMAWQFFATGTSSSLNSIVGKANLVTRVYIPRQILVLSNVLAALINSLLTFVVLLVMIVIVLGHLPLTFPLFLLIFIPFFFFVYGAGLLLSSLYVYFRDLSQIWTVLVQVLFFCSPIFYPISIVPASVLPYYQLNPVTQFIGMFRDVLVAGNLPSLFGIAVIIGFAAAAFLVGSLVFARLHPRFAEELG
jgi:lipopolysaccharide transport system permease protein